MKKLIAITLLIFTAACSNMWHHDHHQGHKDYRHKCECSSHCNGRVGKHEQNVRHHKEAGEYIAVGENHGHCHSHK